MQRRCLYGHCVGCEMLQELQSVGVQQQFLVTHQHTVDECMILWLPALPACHCIAGPACESLGQSLSAGLQTTGLFVATLRKERQSWKVLVSTYLSNSVDWTSLDLLLLSFNQGRSQIGKPSQIWISQNHPFSTYRFQNTPPDFSELNGSLHFIFPIHNP